MTGIAIYAALFLSAFLAATIFPAQSELGLAALLVDGAYSPILLVLVASIGNTLGAAVNWAIGRGLDRLGTGRWLPVTPQQMERAAGWYARLGRWSLLLSWAPIVGDPLTVAAGVMREPLWSFVLLVAAAKTLRYIAVAMIALNLI